VKDLGIQPIESNKTNFTMSHRLLCLSKRTTYPEPRRQPLASGLQFFLRCFAYTSVLRKNRREAALLWRRKEPILFSQIFHYGFIQKQLSFEPINKKTIAI
jgi:hypothetical protein